MRRIALGNRSPPYPIAVGATRSATRTLQAGLDVTYGRFRALDTPGFISGPWSPTIGIRVALKTDQEGAWQKGYTRGPPSP